MELILVSLGLCVLICLLSHISLSFKLISSKNQPLYHWPFVGALPYFLWNFHHLPEWITGLFLSLDNGVGSHCVKGPMFSKLVYLVTCHPQNMEYILKTNFSNFPKGPDFKEIFDVLGDGIFAADGESWSFQRKMIHELFISAKFRSVLARITRKMAEEELIPTLAHMARQDCVVDLQDLFKRLAFDSTMEAICGSPDRSLSRDLPHNEFAEAMDIVQEAVLYRHALPMCCWKLMRLLKVGRERSLAKAMKTMDLVLKKHISQKRESLRKGEQSSGDLLSMIIGKCSAEISFANDEFIRDVMLSLVFGGKDTVASSLVWFFWMIAKTPDVERKILEELKSLVLKKTMEDEYGLRITSPWVFDMEDVKDLVYLHAALCELMRLCSPVHLNSKSVMKEDILPDGTVVKPGMQILIHYYSQGRMPWIWGENSTEFKPERWIDGEGKLSRKELSKFFAFSCGPRSCLGKDMAFKQLKVYVAAVLFNFHVEVMDGQRGCSKPAITLDMKNGLFVKIRERVM